MKDPKQLYITEDILKNIGFENTTTSIEKEYYEKYFFIEDYSSWKRDTSDIDGKNYIIIDFMKGIVNSDNIWNMHLDNNICQTIGSADISTIWQFNTLMEVFNSKFRLS